MRTTTGSVHHNSSKPSSPTYPPSVPISVYRELAAELQATQARLDALTNKNQQLVQENQLLRQEITKVVQSFLHLQNLVDSPAISSYHQTPRTSANHQATEARPPQHVSRSRQPVVPARPSVTAEVPSHKSRASDFSVPIGEINYPMAETVYIEEQEVNYYPPKQTEVKEFSGWWLALTILLIMFTAFGAGYLIVRPLFQHQSR
ncbi:bZIP transcription factor [Halotia branconii]|uniref:BZIP transcription factor n=1 Tax=Halotia branconii CENA392 TaxID=1539056 RepID=A0AAJ6NNL1_9CYAN|nr:bZIP transcription factor [Halotia branconii]WGV23780.1 bZIP transcription factor [Halotia branconii CENA392]